MAFPLTDRVIYSVNPLTEVICQLRFPTILKLSTMLPADFQDRVRQQYPQYTEKQGGGLGQFLPQSMSGSSPGFPLLVGPVVHEFTTEEGAWVISLNQDSLALTTRNYTRWEEFRERLNSILEAFLAVYQPSYFGRVGLRYQDVIIRSRVNLSHRSWADLLAPHIAGMLSSTDIADQVSEMASQSLISLGENHGSVRIQYGLGRVPNSTEPCFIIDSDFYKEDKTEITHVRDVLDRFNRQASSLFRWCITDELHLALHPGPI